MKKEKNRVASREIGPRPEARKEEKGKRKVVKVTPGSLLELLTYLHTDGHCGRLLDNLTLMVSIWCVLSATFDEVLRSSSLAQKKRCQSIDPSE